MRLSDHCYDALPNNPTVKIAEHANRRSQPPSINVSQGVMISSPSTTYTLPAFTDPVVLDVDVAVARPTRRNGIHPKMSLEMDLRPRVAFGFVVGVPLVVPISDRVRLW